MAAVKIKSVKVRKNGERGFTVSLPQVWVSDLCLKAGDKLDVFRDEKGTLSYTKSAEETHD